MNAALEPNIVSPCHGCAPIEQSLIFIEMLPCDLRDIMGKTGDCGTDRRRPEDNLLGYQSTYDAVIDAERIGLRLMEYVKPENLFLLFGQSLQRLDDTLTDKLSPFLFGDGFRNPHDQGDEQNRRGNQENETHPHAVIVCKFGNAEAFRKFTRGPENHSCDDHDHRYMTWREFQGFKAGLKIDHDKKLTVLDQPYNSEKESAGKNERRSAIYTTEGGEA